MGLKIENDDVLTLIDQMTAEFYSITYFLLERMYEIDPALNISVVGKRITLTKEENWKKWIFGITPTSRAISLEFNHGEKVADPKSLLQGTQKVKFIHFKELKDAKKIQAGLVELFKNAIAARDA
jgi:hypothetical protein